MKTGWHLQRSQGSNFTDVIFRSTKSGSLGPGGWSSPQQVLNHSHVSWASYHICDPSVIRGNFVYNGNSYAYAMYFTAHLQTQPEAAIGVAFSNNGTSWTPHSSPVVVPFGTTPGYGAGMSGVAFHPTSGKLLHAYLDSTLNPLLRLNESTNGVSFSPSPPYETQLHAAGRQGNDGQGPDIAYNPVDGHWYATIKNHDPMGIYDGESRVLSSTNPGDLFGAWQVIGIFNSSVTGWPQNHNPGLGKHSDGTLLVDSQGWSYVFFSVGNERPDVGSWEVAQGRFRPGTTPTNVLVSVDKNLPGYLSASSTGGGVTVGYTPSSAVVAIPGGTTANTDNLWNVQNDLHSKPGFNTFVAAGAENAPLVSIEVRGLKIGTSFDVFGRYGTAVLQVPPNHYGIEMGLAPTQLSRYDQTTSPHSVVSNWSNWQEWEVFIGSKTVDSSGILRLYIDDDSVNRTASWTGLRMVLR